MGSEMCIRDSPNAFVDPSAQLHDGVIISQGAIVGPNVIIGKGTEIGANAVVTGRTQLGNNNKVFPTAFIRIDPPDLKYTGAPTEEVIGDNNTLRESIKPCIICFTAANGSSCVSPESERNALLTVQYKSTQMHQKLLLNILNTLRL